MHGAKRRVKAVTFSKHHWKKWTQIFQALERFLPNIGKRLLGGVALDLASLNRFEGALPAPLGVEFCLATGKPSQK